MPVDRDQAVRVFKAAWEAADARGETGHRTEAGIDAVLELRGSEGEEPPEFWWQSEDSARLINTVWVAVEELFCSGVDTEVKLSKPGQPVLTIAFDHDVIEEDGDF